MNPPVNMWPLFFVCGFFLVMLALRIRRRAGFAAGRQVAADNLTLVSTALGLSGRPDRIIYKDGHYIPEEKKSAKRVYPGHEMQLGAYFLLIEAHYGRRPPHGFIVLGDGRREKIANTSALRQKVAATADAMRKSMMQPDASLPRGHNNAAKCRSCAMAAYCNEKIS